MTGTVAGLGQAAIRPASGGKLAAATADPVTADAGGADAAFEFLAFFDQFHGGGETGRGDSGPSPARAGQQLTGASEGIAPAAPAQLKTRADAAPIKTKTDAAPPKPVEELPPSLGVPAGLWPLYKTETPPVAAAAVARPNTVARGTAEPDTAAPSLKVTRSSDAPELDGDDGDDGVPELPDSDSAAVAIPAPLPVVATPPRPDEAPAPKSAMEPAPEAVTEDKPRLKEPDLPETPAVVQPAVALPVQPKASTADKVKATPATPADSVTETPVSTVPGTTDPEPVYGLLSRLLSSSSKPGDADGLLPSRGDPAPADLPETGRPDGAAHAASARAAPALCGPVVPQQAPADQPAPAEAAISQPGTANQTQTVSADRAQKRSADNTQLEGPASDHGALDYMAQTSEVLARFLAAALPSQMAQIPTAAPRQSAVSALAAIAPAQYGRSGAPLPASGSDVQGEATGDSSGDALLLTDFAEMAPLVPAGGREKTAAAAAAQPALAQRSTPGTAVDSNISSTPVPASSGQETPAIPAADGGREAPRRVQDRDSSSMTAANITSVRQETYFAPPVPSPALQVIDRIVSELQIDPPASTARSAGSGEDAQQPVKVLQLQLNPPELGPLTIRMTMRNGALDLRLEAGQQDTARQIDRDREAISGILRSAGYLVDGLSVQIAAPARPDNSSLFTGTGSQQQGQQQSPQGWQQSGGHNPGQSWQGGRDGNGAYAGNGDETRENRNSRTAGALYL